MFNSKCLIFVLFVGCCLALPSQIDKEVNNEIDTLEPRALFLQTGYLVVEDTQNQTNYLISTKVKADYFKAQSICKHLDMRLFKVDSPAKNELIKTLISDYTSEGPFWMGAHRLTDGKTWTWANNIPMEYFNWDLHEPNNAKGDEMCIEVYHRDAVWDDQRCTEKIYFICESQKNSFAANFGGLM